MADERSRCTTDRRRRSSLAAAALVLAVATAAALTPGRARAEAAVCGTTLSIESVLQRLNEIRAAGRICRAGALPGAAVVPLTLTWNASLATAAQTQSQEMALVNRMSHRDRADRSLGDRLKAIGYRFAAAYENVAVGYGSLDDVVEAWLRSEHHCETLMNAAVAELGLACRDAAAADAAGPARAEYRYWTLVVATPPKP